MTVGIFSAEVIFALILTTVLLNRYGNWKTQNIVVTFAVLISWYFSLLIIFVLPIDISLVSYFIIVRLIDLFLCYSILLIIYSFNIIFNK
jgi:hypothetical protein